MITIRLYRYGIDITNATLQTKAYELGIEKAVSEMTQAEKMQLRMLAILEQSKVSWGDLANTINSPSNMIRQFTNNLKEAGMILGQLFIPLLQKVLPILNGVMIALKRLLVAVANFFGIKLDLSGFGQGFSGLEENVDGVGDSLDDATNSAKKFKKQLAGFDELENLSSETGKSKLGVGGAGIDLTDEILKATAEYEKAFADAMKRMENDAQKWADRISDFFTFGNVASKISRALSDALESIDWNSIYKRAENFGAGLANFLNDLITPRLFGNVGRTIANALNTAVYSALAFAENFDWGNFGESLATGVNEFFENFDFKALAKTVNKWAKGILDTAIKFLKKTDWWKIGKQIGTFLADIDLMSIAGKIGRAIWEAINAGIEMWAGMFSKAPFETVLVSLVAMPKLLKAIASTKIVTSIKKLADGFKLVSTSLLGNQQSLTLLSTQYPKLARAVDVARQAFANFVVGTRNGNIFTGLNQGLTTVRNNLTGLQKGVITGVAALAEFHLVSNVFDDMIQGSENLVSGIAKIGATVGIAGVAMYTALGPAGIAVAGITALVGAVKGISDAFSAIEAEKIGLTIKNALTNPGGTPLENVVENVANSISSIGDRFSTINEKSQSLEASRQNIQSVWEEIELIRTSMDNGVLSVEEGTTQLSELFSALATSASDSFHQLELTLLSAFGENGVLSATFKELGVNTENITGAIVTSTANVETRVGELTSLLSTTDPTNPKYEEYLTELMSLTGGYGELEKAVSDFSLAIDATNIDYGKIVAEEGTLNTDYVTTQLEILTGAINTANTDVTTGVENINTALQEKLNQAIAIGDTENQAIFEEALKYIPDTLGTIKGDIELQGLELTNAMQSDVIGGINKVIEDAGKEWENMNPLEQAFAGTKDFYIQKAVENYQNNVIEPLSNEIETAMEQVGIDGAGWSKEAGEKIVDSLFDFEMSDNGGMVTKLNEDYKNIINSAVEDIPEIATEKGKDAVEGYAKGFSENQIIAEEAGKALANIAMKAIAEAQDSHSPSKVTQGLGKDAVDGYNLGFEDNESSTLDIVDNFITNVTDTLANIIEPFRDIGVRAMQGLSNGLESMKQSLLDIAQRIVDSIGNTINSALDKIFNDATSKASSLTGGLGGAIGGIVGNNSKVAIPQFATGGFPSQYSLFMAGENGIPEIAGTVGGKTAVAGGAEITGIRQEIRATANEEMALLRQQNALLQAILEKEFGISQDALFSSVRNSANDYHRRTGNFAFDI